MAIYHLSIKIITRGKGKSAVAAAAYRAAERIYCEREGMEHDYLRKGGVVYKEIFLPENAPAAYKDRSTLWNAVENSEKYINAQLSREFEIALPVELTREQNISLVRKFVTEVLANAGMCADACYHDTGEGNPHAHIMCTMRPIEKDGKWGAKSRTVDGRKINTVDWNDHGKAEYWRGAWATYCNDALRESGHETTIDHRSYERQGIEQIPTVHMGVAATHMERKGIGTELGERNREIEFSNRQIRQLNARINKLEKWITDEKADDKIPTLYEALSNILDNDKYHQITRLKNAAAVLVFLQRNKITDMEGLEAKVIEMKGNLVSVRDELKKTDRRIETLKTHLSYSENYKECRKYKRHYEKLKSAYEDATKETGFGAKRKAEKALDAVNGYAEYRRDELAKFDEADTYLRKVMQSHFDPGKLPPITKWKQELAEKTAARNALRHKFDALKDDTKRVEQIKRSIESLLSDGTGETEAAVTEKNIGENGISGKKGILDTIRKYQQTQVPGQQYIPERKPMKSHDAEL